MHLFRRAFVSLLVIGCSLMAACTQPQKSTGPKFSGRLLLLAGENAGGADLVELTAAPTDATYNFAVLLRGVLEAAPSPDQTRLLYVTKEGIGLRDLHTGAEKTLVRGDNFCLAWSPDGTRFSYKQREEANSQAAIQTKLYVANLEGKAKPIWQDVNLASDQASAVGNAAAASGCVNWIAPDRFVFERFLGAAPNQKSRELLKPNTTTLVILGDNVKLIDTDRKYSIESVCQAGTVAILRPRDEDQPLLLARSLDQMDKLNPSPAPCSGCRFLGFAAKSCVPFFFQDAASTSTDLVSLNPTNWQRQRGAHINRTFSLAARALIKSSARLMIVGDIPSSLLLIDTESGDITDLAPKTAAGATSGPLTSPLPIVWIEN